MLNIKILNDYFSLVFENLDILLSSSHLTNFISVKKEHVKGYDFLSDNINIKVACSCPLQSLFTAKSHVTNNNNHNTCSLDVNLHASLSPPSSINNKKCIDDYQLVKVLGKGCMGKVILARDKDSERLYALKAINKMWVASHGKQEIEHIVAEQRILAELSRNRHPFLIHLHCSFQNSEYLFLVLDYVGGGDLATQLSLFHRFSDVRSKFYCAQMVSGIQELHRLGIIYRDLKPENVLLSPSGTILLTDFGLSKSFRLSHKFNSHDKDCPGGDSCIHAKTKTFCGTPEYLAPEILKEEEYGYEGDWWSLGTFLYEMLTGMTPFWAEDHLTMYRRVLQDDLIFPEQLVSLDAQDFIARLLNRNASERLGHNGTREITDHLYFRNIDWDDLYNFRVSPPYVPKVKSETDLTFFSEEFTNMSPRLSTNNCYIEPRSFTSDTSFDNELAPLSASVQEQFVGYTFVSTSARIHMTSNLRSLAASFKKSKSDEALKWMARYKKRRGSDCVFPVGSFQSFDKETNHGNTYLFDIEMDS
jgi:serine/threonine protein kinase